MIYVIRLIKRLSAQNVRAYTGRANLRPSDARRWERVVEACTVARKDSEQKEHGVEQRTRFYTSAKHDGPSFTSSNTLFRKYRS